MRDEALLVEQCATLRHAQAVKAVEYWVQLADGECGDSAEPVEPASSLHASATWKGRVRIDGTLGRIDGAIVTGELDRLEREVYLADQAAGITRSAGERRAVALVEMATRSAATPADAQRPRPLFTVILGDDSFSKLCELGNGTVITPKLIVPLQIDLAMGLDGTCSVSRLTQAPEEPALSGSPNVRSMSPLSPRVAVCRRQAT